MARIEFDHAAKIYPDRTHGANDLRDEWVEPLGEEGA
jgi:hypothetical protein